MRVPDDRFEKGFRYDTFLCRKDPSMAEESGGYCELCDRVGAKADEKFVALAIELEAVKEGKRVKELKVAYDSVTNKESGETVEYPRWGIVIQASKNFFSYLAAYHENTGDIRDVAWDILREGDSTDTKYHQFPLPTPLPDLSKLEIPSLDDLLENMGSDEKYQDVETIAAGSQPSAFGKSSKPVDAGTVPAGDRESEFEKIRAELESKNQTPVEAY